MGDDFLTGTARVLQCVSKDWQGVVVPFLGDGLCQAEDETLLPGQPCGVKDHQRPRSVEDFPNLLAMDGRHNFIAVDTEFRRFVRERYHGGRAVSERTMLRRYAKWGRWKYLAYWSELWGSVAEALEPLEKRGQ